MATSRFFESASTKKSKPVNSNPRPKKQKQEPAIESPPQNYQMSQRSERINYLVEQAREKKPMNVRELAALAEEAFPGISTPTRNAYARAANRILKLPYTADFPEI